MIHQLKLQKNIYKIGIEIFIDNENYQSINLTECNRINEKLFILNQNQKILIKKI